MPGFAKPVAPYSRVEPAARSRGQRRGIVRCDGRSRAGRLLKHPRKALCDHLGPHASTAQLAIVEHIAFLELRAALLSQKIIDGTYTNYDSSTHYALIGALRRCYREIGIESPTPKLAELLR